MNVSRGGAPAEQDSPSHQAHEWEQPHKNKFLWMSKSEDVTKDENASFHKLLSNGGEDHLDVELFSVEGQLEFRALC